MNWCKSLAKKEQVFEREKEESQTQMAMRINWLAFTTKWISQQLIQ